MPVGPGAAIENSGRRAMHDLAQLVRADATVQRPQILGGAIGHDVRQKVNGVGQRFFGFFEPDHATGHGQQGWSDR